MNIDIKLHKLDLPDDLAFSDKIAIDCEFMGLNVERDRLCLVQISNGNNDAEASNKSENNSTDEMSDDDSQVNVEQNQKEDLNETEKEQENDIPES